MPSGENAYSADALPHSPVSPNGGPNQAPTSACWLTAAAGGAPARPIADNQAAAAATRVARATTLNSRPNIDAPFPPRPAQADPHIGFPSRRFVLILRKFLRRRLRQPRLRSPLCRARTRRWLLVAGGRRVLQPVTPTSV